MGHMLNLRTKACFLTSFSKNKFRSSIRVLLAETTNSLSIGHTVLLDPHEVTSQPGGNPYFLLVHVIPFAALQMFLLHVL
jgi:hypothetical protein